MRGAELTVLTDGYMDSGKHDIIWDARNDEGLSVSAGMYVYKMVSGDFVEVNKMLLLK